MTFFEVNGGIKTIGTNVGNFFSSFSYIKYYINSLYMFIRKYYVQYMFVLSMLFVVFWELHI